LLHAQRLWRWQPLRTRARPILWVLHAAYAWLPIGLVLLALSQLGAVGVSAGIHALAVGATGGLIIGMVTRTARGHTGGRCGCRGSRSPPTCWWPAPRGACVAAAAVAQHLVRLAGWPLPLAWGLAFALYLFVFAPWLLAPRLDGKDG
jgi:uncharacterized protein involved in response to NO